MKIERNNCFDLIRHFAALMVLFSHHFALSGLSEPVIPGWDTLGFLAVSIFFSISGYLMHISYRNSEGYLDFIGKRCKRIFPGLIVCSFIMVFIIGAIFTSSQLLSYIFNAEQVKTFILLSAFSGRSIPTVFSDFILPNALNGSLWTLPVEFMCYLIIGMVFSLHYSWKSVLGLFLVSSVSKMCLTYSGSDYSFYFIPMSYLTMFGVAFSFGALMSMTQESWMKYRPQIFIASILIIYITRGMPSIGVLGLMSISAITIIMGVSVKDKFINGKFDISYGIYIYSFPVQQIVINKLTHDFWLSMIISIMISIILGYLSYKYVEKPFLKKKTSKIILKKINEPT